MEDDTMTDQPVNADPAPLPTREEMEALKAKLRAAAARVLGVTSQASGQGDGMEIDDLGEQPEGGPWTIQLPSLDGDFPESQEVPEGPWTLRLPSLTDDDEEIPAEARESAEQESVAESVADGNPAADQQGAFMAWLTWQGLNPNSNRLQAMAQAEGKLWHRGYNGYFAADTLEFYNWNDEPQRWYYRNANRFEKREDYWKPDFWLIRENDGSYSGKFVNEDPGKRGLLIPWEHLVEHLYEFCSLDLKGRHTFWPIGTTQDQLLDYLVQALNENRRIDLDGGGAAYAVLQDDYNLTTFFPTRPPGHEDVYEADELSDIGE
jgi:hypothetical protein